MKPWEFAPEELDQIDRDIKAREIRKQKPSKKARERLLEHEEEAAHGTGVPVEHYRAMRRLESDMAREAAEKGVGVNAHQPGMPPRQIAGKEADVAEKWGAGQAQLRMRQGLAELGNAFGKATPDTPTQDMPGVVVPTPAEVAEIKEPKEAPEFEMPEPEMG